MCTLIDNVSPYVDKKNLVAEEAPATRRMMESFAEYMAHGLNNIHYYLWIEPDLRLIECLALQLITIITFVMSVSSVITMVAYTRKYIKVCHCTRLL